MQQVERLKEIVKELIYRGEIRTQRDFGEKLGYKPAFTSQIMSGHKQPKDLPNKIYQTFGIKWDTGIKTPDTVNEPGEVYNKYVALLERQEQRAEAIGKHAAAEAVREFAANYATKKELAEVQVSLDEAVQDLQDHTALIHALQEFVVTRFAHVQKQDPNTVSSELDGISSRIASAYKKDNEKHKDKKGTRVHGT